MEMIYNSGCVIKMQIFYQCVSVMYTYKIFSRMIEHNDQNNISSGAEPINLRGRGDLWIPQQTIYELCSLLLSYYNVYMCSTYVNRGGGTYNFLLPPL